MNYNNISARELDIFRKEFPEYSMSELIFAIFRLSPKVSKFSDILKVTDEEFYHLVTEAIKEEKETPFA